MVLEEVILVCVLFALTFGIVYRLYKSANQN